MNSFNPILSKSFVSLAISMLVCGSAMANNEQPPASQPNQSQSGVNQQAQGQGQSSSNTNFSNSVSSNGPVNSTGGNSSSRASASGGRSEANNSMTLRMDAQLRDPVSTAVAPSLDVSNGTCFGSAGLGAQSIKFGISVGGPTLDGGCDIRYDVMLLNKISGRKAAMARFCHKEGIRQAMKDAGEPCDIDLIENNAAKLHKLSIDGYSGNDEIVRARMAR